MKTMVYNQEGKEVGEALLPKDIFGVKINPDLIYQVSTIQAANRRQVIASTKTRGEVRGGGKKPWRQKGTGRARHGSIRSPLWRGGGAVFGPNKEKVFKRFLNKKTAKSALFMVLSSKVKDKELIILEDLKIEQPKTKLMAGILGKFPVKGKSLLIVVPGNKDKTIFRASKNIAKTDVAEARNLNSLDLLNHKYLLMTKEAVKAIKDTFLK